MGGAATTPIAAAMGHENLPTLIEIQAPLVASSLPEDLEYVAVRMLAPNPGTQFSPF
jgi:hypothetical protein